MGMTVIPERFEHIQSTFEEMGTYRFPNQILKMHRVICNSRFMRQLIVGVMILATTGSCSSEDPLTKRLKMTSEDPLTKRLKMTSEEKDEKRCELHIKHGKAETALKTERDSKVIDLQNICYHSIEAALKPTREGALVNLRSISREFVYAQLEEKRLRDELEENCKLIRKKYDKKIKEASKKAREEFWRWGLHPD